jgi:ArsR family transcriptional regulator, arsenate/arsenite/antimonite-responsive transcriptional repressor
MSKKSGKAISAFVARARTGIVVKEREGRMITTTAMVLRKIEASGALAVGVAPKFAPTLTEDEAVSQARVLKALVDPTRLRILSLISRYEGEACVSEIVESFTLEQPTISHHLRILRDAGLVDCRKKALWSYYYVCREALSRAQDMIKSL